MYRGELCLIADHVECYNGLFILYNELRSEVVAGRDATYIIIL